MAANGTHKIDVTLQRVAMTTKIATLERVAMTTKIATLERVAMTTKITSDDRERWWLGDA